METSTRVNLFAGGLKRFFAYVVDILILNIIFVLLYFVLNLSGYDYLDYWVIFFIVYLLYFTLGDSLILNGQTVGKRQLGIQVVNISGASVSPIFSFLRSVFTAIIYFNYHFLILFSNFLKTCINNELLITILILFVISIMFFGVTVFLIFHPYYQGLQDVMFRTFVLKKDSYDKEQIESAFNLTRLTASYFFMVVFTFVSVLVGTIIKLFWV